MAAANDRAAWDRANMRAFVTLVQAIQPDDIVKILREYAPRVPQERHQVPRENLRKRQMLGRG